MPLELTDLETVYDEASYFDAAIVGNWILDGSVTFTDAGRPYGFGSYLYLPWAGAGVTLGSSGAFVADWNTGMVWYNGVIVGVISRQIPGVFVHLQATATAEVVEVILENIRIYDDPGSGNGPRQMTLTISDGVEVLEHVFEITLIPDTPRMLTGTGAGETLQGGYGADTLDGGAGADTLAGGYGDDYLKGGAGADTLRGGPGYDVYLVDDPGDVIDESTGDYWGKARASISWTLSNDVGDLDLLSSAGAIDGTGNPSVNTINGNSYANTIRGMGADDFLYGGGGDDIIEGGDDVDYLDGGGGDDHLSGDDGRDSMAGGAGADYLDGGASYDAMYGGTGNDTYVVDHVWDFVSEDLSAAGGRDTVISSISFTLGDAVENLTFTGSANLTGVGNYLRNVMTGNAGNDLMVGGADIDTISGGDGDDVLGGDADNDVLNGGGGADALWGGVGSDRLTGGAGADTFVFFEHDIRRSATGQTPWKDQVFDLDFTGQGDIMDLSRIDADLNTAGDQAFVWVTAFTGAAGQALLRYVPASSATYVEVDLDGDGKIDLRIEVNGDLRATTGNLYTGGGDTDGGWVL